MAILTVTEQQQNKDFLNKLLSENYADFIFSENIKLAFLKKCEKKAIWLLGLSPLVQTTFIQALTLALQDTQHNIEDKLNRVFQVLCDKSAEENAYLKWQFTQSAKYNSQPQLTIAQYLDKNQAIPADYWLQTDDMINALEPLAKHAEIYIHPPVTRIDASVTACVVAALNTTAAKVAYVTVESGGHWTLDIYKKQSNKIVEEHYNPPGDGKCGDHVVDYIYADAQKILKENTGYHHIGNVRQQTIQTIQGNNTFVKTEQQRSPLANSKTDFSELDKLYHQWNALANQVIDEVAHYNDVERAEVWNNFFNDVTHSIEKRSWNPELFHNYQCAAEVNKHEETKMVEAIRRSLIVS